MTRKQSLLSGTGRHVELTITLVSVTISFQSSPERGALGQWGYRQKKNGMTAPFTNAI